MRKVVPVVLCSVPALRLVSLFFFFLRLPVFPKPEHGRVLVCWVRLSLVVFPKCAAARRGQAKRGSSHPSFGSSWWLCCPEDFS